MVLIIRQFMATPEKFTSLVEKECGYLLLDELNIFIGLKIIVLTRKFSCVNARGIPTAAYQVLPRWGTPPARSNREGVPKVGYPLPGSWLWEGVPGVPPIGVPLHQGTPILAPGGYPGYPPVLAPGGYRGYPHWGTPHSGSGGVPGVLPIRVPPHWSTPQLGYPPSWLGGVPRVPPVGVPPGCGQTEGQTRVKT